MGQAAGPALRFLGRSVLRAHGGIRPRRALRNRVLYFFGPHPTHDSLHRRQKGDVLILNDAAARALEAHAESGYPREVCGLLVGRIDSPGGARRILEARQAGNLNRERATDRYDLDPTDYLRIESEARALRLEVLGVYHSHPDHPSLPSETDRMRAEEIWQEGASWSYLILEVAAGRLASRRSWVLRERIFHEEEIRVEPAGAGSGPCPS